MIWIMHFVNFISHFIRATQFVFVLFYFIYCSAASPYASNLATPLGSYLEGVTPVTLILNPGSTWMNND